MATVTPFSTPPGKPWYAQRWPWLLMLGPFLVILAGSYTIWLAVSRPDALVVDDYYTQGKAINQDLRRDRAATRLELVFQGSYDAAAGKLNGNLRSAGKPVTGLIRLHLAHPTQPEKDLQFSAPLNAQGAFSLDVPMLERSRWQVLVESAQRDWRLSGVWQWPTRQQITLQADAPAAE